MKLIVQGAAWAVPRPRVWANWDWMTVELGVGFASGGAEDFFYVGIRHELTPRQADFLDRADRLRRRQRVRFARRPRPGGPR